MPVRQAYLPVLRAFQNLIGGKNEPLLLKNLLVNFNQGKHEEVRKLVGELIRVDFIQMKD
ncbi:hypothetical protein NEIFLAOT_00759 [Neisseria flavescens NRL30031/H210]|uniref:Uncharacterized protein n=1 Tax=Neisseria flavescens NRL30031/H210 TaxID=546264 RepID=C0ELF4_NEIFL|nr:hypothetical protein NEIFLAOT_00759 [Neisseria flavescens NRL30031/H210]